MLHINTQCSSYSTLSHFSLQRPKAKLEFARKSTYHSRSVCEKGILTVFFLSCSYVSDYMTSNYISFWESVVYLRKVFSHNWQLFVSTICPSKSKDSKWRSFCHFFVMAFSFQEANHPWCYSMMAEILLLLIPMCFCSLPKCISHLRGMMCCA